ncbi:unnamed protein product [Moneuplotes crassus]|uniref:Uncharacterized protein n=1 Tax=Euplotes crassus TaxID=5936 RepID=A0AAD2D0T6_EUPCR|nr:unnamed protein product [Moneuplotes crassus]
MGGCLSNNATSGKKFKLGSNKDYYSRSKATNLTAEEIEARSQFDHKKPCKEKIKQAGEILKKELGIDFQKLINECEDLVFPPDDISSYEYELFLEINIMRTNPEKFVSYILDNYITKFSNSEEEKFKETCSHLKSMMKLKPVKWDPRIESSIADYQDKGSDITERLEKLGINREVLSTEVLLKGSKFAFETLCNLLKSTDDDKNLEKEKLLFSMFRNIAIGCTDKLDVAIVLTND